MSPYRFERFHQKVTTQKIALAVKRLIIVICVGFLSFLLLNILFPLPDKVEYSTIIRGSKGEVLHAYLTNDDKWRMKTELEEISPLLQKTIIAKEDKYF